MKATSASHNSGIHFDDAGDRDIKKYDYSSLNESTPIEVYRNKRVDAAFKIEDVGDRPVHPQEYSILGEESPAMDVDAIIRQQQIKKNDTKLNCSDVGDRESRFGALEYSTLGEETPGPEFY